MKRKRKSGSLKSHGINPQKFSRGQIKFYLYLIPIAFFMLLPILFIVINAFKPIDELFAYPPRFFVRKPTLDNFTRLFSLSSNTNIPASRYLFNSIVAAAIFVAAMVFMSSAAGYVLSKKKFRFKKFLFAVNTLALMFVTVAVVIPRYFVVIYLGLQNNFLANIIPMLAMPVGLFLLKQFIDQIPEALVEAAHIDGASDYKILVRIIMPLIKPALATVAILGFQVVWTSVESSTMYIHKESLKTFSFYMSTLTGAAGNTLTSSANTVAGQGIAASAALIMFLPNIILFIILQSQVMNTMTHSGIK